MVVVPDIERDAGPLPRAYSRAFRGRVRRPLASATSLSRSLKRVMHLHRRRPDGLGHGLQRPELVVLREESAAADAGYGPGRRWLIDRPIAPAVKDSSSAAAMRRISAGRRGPFPGVVPQDEGAQCHVTDVAAEVRRCRLRPRSPLRTTASRAQLHGTSCRNASSGRSSRKHSKSTISSRCEPARVRSSCRSCRRPARCCPATAAGSRSGSHHIAPSRWVWVSMTPGIDESAGGVDHRLAVGARSGPTSTITPSRTRTSAGTGAAPVPSMTVPPG